MERARLAIVVPCYNEEEVLPMSNEILVNLMQEMVNEELITNDSYILYVNDGSKDKTWEMLEELHTTSHFINCLKLSRNRGHQNAVMAGLMQAKNNCDCCISIDADLQDDINVIKDMVKNFLNGDQVVLGVRNQRTTDTFFKRTTARAFYDVMNWMGAKTVKDHTDFRLLSNRALQELERYQEYNLFLRGIVIELGFKQSIVTYDRKERMAGETKYPLKKMLALAMDGITSFSVKPIVLVRNLGITLSFLAVLAVVVFVILAICNIVLPIDAYVIAAVFFVGGLQLVGLGIVGEYVGKIYIEVKHRPRYIVEKTLLH